MEAYLDLKQREDIGFEYVIAQLKLLSHYGNDRLTLLSAYTSENELQEELDNVELVQVLLNKYPKIFNELDVYLARIKNIDYILNGLSFMNLDEVEIFEIKKFIFNVNKINDLLIDIKKETTLFNIIDFTELFAYLDIDNTKMPFFSISDRYSKDLTRLRNAFNEDKDNNEIKNLLKDELEKVRKDISSFIAKYQDDLIKTTIKIGYLDLLIAKARLANKYQLTKPLIANEISLTNAYNPMVKAIVEENKLNYIKLNINIDNKINIITGSNMAGKSVTLKNILVNILCFQYGIYPFCDKASLMLLDYIGYISDELQDVSNSLSSFGKEISTLNKTIDFINNKKGILVFDELARGTNPIEAKMIIAGLCKYLNKLDVTAILATHLDLDMDLECGYYQVVGLSNLEDEIVDEMEIVKVMDYSLQKVDKDTKVPNDAFKVMSFLKLNKELKEIIEQEYKRELKK